MQRLCMIALLTLAIAGGAHGASAATAPPLPPAPPLVPSPYILIDLTSGAVLAERSAEALRYPASLTKLMTAYLTFEALASGRLRPTSPVVESAAALAQPPSKMGFALGTVITVDNALKMLIVKSANDVAVALGETISGSKQAFVAEMNAAAVRLGMSQTRFENPNGLHDDSHVSTARDLAILGRAIWQTFPQYRDLFAIPAIKSGKAILRSENSLLERFDGANGMKTGYTCAAGFNLVASAARGERALLVVVLAEISSRARAELAAGLLDLGFAGRFSSAGAVLADFRSPAGTSAPIDLRDMVCKRHAPVELEAVAEALPLGPAVRVVEPVKVFTGGADPGRPGENVAAKVDARPAAGKADAVAVGTGSKAVTAAAAAAPSPSVGAPIPRPKPAGGARASAGGSTKAASVTIRKPATQAEARD